MPGAPSSSSSPHPQPHQEMLHCLGRPSARGAQAAAMLMPRAVPMIHQAALPRRGEALGPGQLLLQGHCFPALTLMRRGIHRRMLLATGLRVMRRDRHSSTKGTIMNGHLTCLRLHSVMDQAAMGC